MIFVILHFSVYSIVMFLFLSEQISALCIAESIYLFRHAEENVEIFNAEGISLVIDIVSLILLLQVREKAFCVVFTKKLDMRDCFQTTSVETNQF